MADFEDEASANLAPVNGLQDEASELQHPSLGADPSQFAKLGDPADPYNPTDPYAQQGDPFASQPSSTMAHQDFDSMGGYRGEMEYPPANEAASGDYGQFQEDPHDDLPANFAREAARNQPFTEAGDQPGGYEEHPGMTPISGRDDEADEIAAPAANGSNPFAMDAMNQGMGDVSGGGSGFVDNNDRPIMGYNPFLNEENRGEAEEEDGRGDGQFDHSQDMEFYKQQSFGGPADSLGEGQGQNPMVRGDDERDFGQPDYHRLEEDEEEDDADLQMEPVENIQQPPEEELAPLEQGTVGKEEVMEDRPMGGDMDDRLMPQQMEGNAESPVSFPNDEIHSDDTCSAQQPDESDAAVPAVGMGLDARSTEPDFDQPGEVQDQTRDYQEDEYHQDKAQAPDIDFEKEGIYKDEQREEIREEDEENIPPQTKGPGEEDLGIVNQAFSDDVDMEGGKGIPEEEEFVQREVPAAEKAPGLSTDDYDDGEDEKEAEKEMMEREQPIGKEEEEEEEKNDISVEEKRQEEEEDERMEEQERPMEMNEEKFGGESDEANQAEQGDIMKGDYSQEQLGSEEVTDDEVTQNYGGKDFGSRLPESDVFSSEHEDRSYVDNLSELASPDTVPQPLPSPPEPKDMSPFDPLAPTTNSVSPCQEAAASTNLGQHGEFFEPGTVVADETNNTGDFLTAGEVEGETKFGVDGTAITQTATQNNAFLHSDDEEDEEEEEESQQLDQGGVGGTAATTETETSAEDRSGEFGGQGFETMEQNNDNALMSMSMEGSFYDDGGELMGGDDRREENHAYQGGAITEENFIQQDDFEQKQQDSYLMNQAGFEQQIQNDFSENSYQQPSHGDAFGLHEDNVASTQDAFDPLSNATAPPASAMNGVSDEGGNMGGLDSLLDAPVTEQGLQTPVTEKSETADSSVDNVGIDSIVHEFESSVDSQPLQQEQKRLEDALGSVDISEPVPDKPEEPSSSVDEPPTSATKVEEQNAAAPAAAAAGVAAGVAAAAAAAAPGTTKSSTTTTTVKKSSSAKAGGKTTTTTTKVSTKTTANNKAAATTKKTETTTTTSRTTPRKPDSRPTSAATDKKAPAKSTTSPTKAAPSSAKPAGPLPSYAQPVTPRKPREAKVPTPEEKKKLTATPRLPSAGASRTPRPQSATTTTTSTTKSTNRTSTTTASATSRTAQLARPKSSPTKLTNGTTSGPTDTKSTPKKYGIDARNEGYKPGGGNVKITNEKREIKATSRIDAGSKGATPGAGAKPAPAKSSPRTSSTPKSGDVKLKIGSLDNTTHSPGGGNVKIANKKTDYASVGSRIGSKDKADHKPGGGNVKIENRKMKIEAKSKIGSLDNATHRPAGGDKKIESHKLDFKEKASPKIGSLDKQGQASEEGPTEVPAANGATSDN